MPKRKLSNSDRMEIVALKGKKSAYEIAKRYNVSHTAIYKVWKKSELNKATDLDKELLKRILTHISYHELDKILDTPLLNRVSEITRKSVNLRELGTLKEKVDIIKSRFSIDHDKTDTYVQERSGNQGEWRSSSSFRTGDKTFRTSNDSGIIRFPEISTERKELENLKMERKPQNERKDNNIQNSLEKYEKMLSLDETDKRILSLLTKKYKKKGIKRIDLNRHNHFLSDLSRLAFLTQHINSFQLMEEEGLILRTNDTNQWTTR